MIDPREGTKAYLRLMGVVALLGIVSALVTFVFMLLVNQGIALVWEQAMLASGLNAGLFTILVCTLGGLLVGLLVKFFGDHNAIFAELMQEFGRTGRFNYRNAPGIVVTALVSLVSGAALGPEAPLADACGGIGTWTGEKLKLNDQEIRTLGYGGLSGMLASFITNPFAGALLSLESAQGGMTGMTIYFWGLFPSLLSSAVATVVFVGLTGQFFETVYTFPAYIPRLVDLIMAVPLSLIGGAAGLIFALMFKWLRTLMLPLKKHLVLRGVIGGLGMGIIGALLPLTLFSGEEQSVDLVLMAPSIGFGMLDSAGIQQTAGDIPAAGNRLERRVPFPDHVCRNCAGHGGNTCFSGCPHRSHRSGCYGWRAGSCPACAVVCSTLHPGTGAG